MEAAPLFSTGFSRKVYTPSAHTVFSASSTHARMTAMLRPMRTASAREVRRAPRAGARNRTSQLMVRHMLPRVQAAEPAT